MYVSFGMLSWLLRLSQSRYKMRVVSARAYYCLFMCNMLIRPTEDELASLGAPT
jgi:ATP-dependent phosphoenolpyruvate carboxykinase